MLPASRIGPVGNQASGPFLEGVHGLRAIAALSVVVYHAGGSIGSEKYQHIAGIGKATSWMDAGVDLFFVISGFVITLPLFLGRQEQLSTYVFHRILRIYPVALLTAAIFAFFNGMIYHRSLSFDNILSSFLLLPSDTEPVPIVLWTLKQELLFYGFVGIAFLNKRLGLILIATWAVASVAIVTDTVVGRWFFHPRNIGFLFGMIVAYTYVTRPLTPRLSVPMALLGLILFVTSAGWGTYSGASRELLSPILGICGMLTLYGVTAFPLRMPAIVLAMGTASYSIYLIHFLFISAGNKVLTQMLPGLPGIVALLVLVGTASLAGYLYFLVAERPIERWRRALRQRTRSSSDAEHSRQLPQPVILPEGKS